MFINVSLDCCVARDLLFFTASRKTNERVHHLGKSTESLLSTSEAMLIATESQHFVPQKSWSRLEVPELYYITCKK